MTIVLLITIFIFGVALGGYFQKSLSEKMIKDEHNKIYNAKKDDFLEVLSTLKARLGHFKTRVNDNVYISLYLKNHGSIDLIYLMDKNDIAIFQGNRCIHTSDGIQRELVSDIIKQINHIFEKKINDVVELLGFVFYREEFERSFNIKAEDLKKSNLFNSMKGESSDIDKITNENENRFDIDEILDKISAFGMKVLTPEEKEFLDNYGKKN